MDSIDFKNILSFALRASAAYENDAFIRKSFPNTTRVKTLATIDVQYFIEHDPLENIQTISVRGTANLHNALEDAEYTQSSNAKLGIYVHKGFDNDTALIYEDMKPYLIKNAKIKLTGHSLGAAIATLLMMYLHQDGFVIEKSINFGQPKVTNKKGVKAFGFLPLTRVIDENDLVPLVPPITLLDSIHGFYEHLGDEIILLDNDNYQYFNEHDAERKSVGDFWRHIGHESIEDHFMANYLKRIQSKIK
jgi:triacylglycerol lipase